MDKITHPSGPSSAPRVPVPDGLREVFTDVIVALAAINACRRKAGFTVASLTKIMEHPEGAAFLASRDIHPAEALRQLKHAAASPANPAAAEG